ncbi:MAG: ATP-binding protein [Aquaticitalea sp.]
MEQLSKAHQADVKNINSIAIVSDLLSVVCKVTGMGFAAIARVTEDKWIACQVKDDISFGLKPGDELKIKTTICNEIRQSGEAVVINHVNEDDAFRHHHTPNLYGFQSYISVPIIRKDNTFFGTLCAIDPNPHDLNKTEVMSMFKLFSELISFHLETVEKLESTLQSLKSQHEFTQVLEQKVKERTAELVEKNLMLLKSNEEMQRFNYVTSHDLQEPLRKILTFISRFQISELDGMSITGTEYLNKISDSAQRMRLLINDLLSYSQIQESQKKHETLNLDAVLKEVIDNLDEEIAQNSAIIEIHSTCSIKAIPFQITQLFYNLIGNSLKYASNTRQLKISITGEIIQREMIQGEMIQGEIIQAEIIQAENIGGQNIGGQNIERENIEEEIIEGEIIEGENIEEEKNKKSLLANDTYCHIKIEDNGIGFDQKYGDKIFELFQRLHNKTEYSGTGVGLAIVKKIVENHNGIIDVQSSPDKGTIFNIYIPTA